MTFLESVVFPSEFLQRCADNTGDDSQSLAPSPGCFGELKESPDRTEQTELAYRIVPEQVNVITTCCQSIKKALSALAARIDSAVPVSKW